MKGLVTEASALTYPEDASIREDNCVLFRRGNRARRLGMNYEVGHQPSPYNIHNSNQVVGEYRWEAVANDINTNFLCLHVASKIYFYDLSAEPLSGGKKAFEIDLHAYRASNVYDVNGMEVQMSAGKGNLFIVGEQIDPIVVQYDSATDNFTVKVITILIRDFRGLRDGLANDEEPTTFKDAHQYNLMNQGWVNPIGGSSSTAAQMQAYDDFGNPIVYRPPDSLPILQYFIKHNRYPGNNKQWWVAKRAVDSEDGSKKAGEFDPELLNTIYFGNTRAPRGHFIVNAFYIDRNSVAGFGTLPPEITRERPQAVAFYSGRAWYACNSTVYFSQVLDDIRKAGFCYQEADPTAEDISDLVDTDGGVIPIPEMGKPRRMIPMGNGLLVFANNGIWYISGGQGGFTATDISVSKVNPIGTDGAKSIVETEGAIYWWSRVGIQALSIRSGMFGPVEGSFDKVIISQDTIQQYFDDEITDECKNFAKGVYDPATNTVQWLCRSKPLSNLYQYDRVLNLDLSLSAFYPWTVSGPNYLAGAFLTNKVNEPDSETSVRPTFIKYVTATPVDDDNNFSISFGHFRDTTFKDWGQSSYMSFVETGYELLEDAMRDKQTNYVFCYFRKTEENYVQTEADGDYTVDKPSSCYLQVRWDWSNSSVSNRWSSKIQAYRHTRFPNFTEDALAFDTGFPVVVTKNKIRGHGKSIQFRFESDEIGKDFDLLGWAVLYSGNTQP